METTQTAVPERPNPSQETSQNLPRTAKKNVQNSQEGYSSPCTRRENAVGGQKSVNTIKSQGPSANPEIPKEAIRL